MLTHLPPLLLLGAPSKEVKLCGVHSTASLQFSCFPTDGFVGSFYKNKLKQKPNFRKQHIHSLAHSVSQ